MGTTPPNGIDLKTFDQQQEDLFFKTPRTESVYGFKNPIPLPQRMWHVGVGVGWSHDGDGMQPTLSLAFSSHHDFWKLWRLGFALHGLDRIKIAPGVQYTFFFMQNHLRAQVFGGPALLFGKDPLLTSWLSRNSIGLDTGLLFAVFMHPSWGAHICAQMPLFFTETGFGYSPQFTLGFSQNF